MGKWFGKKTAKQYYLDGSVHAFKGEYEKAIVSLSKAIELEPEYLDAYFHRGNAYLDRGDNPHAVADFDYVILKSPDHHLAYYNRSIADMGLGKMDQALSDVDQAILLAAGEPGYYNQRCIIHSFREEYDLAIKDADKVIELGDAKSGYNNRAIVFEKKGDLLSAIAEWTKVLAADPNDSKAYCRRGLLFGKGRDSERAIQDLEEGLKHKERLTDALRDQSEEMLRELEAASRK